MRWSTQYKYITRAVIAFQNNKDPQDSFISFSDRELKKAKVFLNPSKYEQWTTAEFQFLVIWTCFNFPGNVIDTLKTLEEYTKDDIKDVKARIREVIQYRTTFERDRDYLTTKIVTQPNIQKMFQQRKISIFTLYWYLKNTGSRILNRKIQRLETFMKFFPDIKKDLKI